ncbi:hypothetical protein TrRE_jg12551, partial [Triparma retinervis]
MSHEGSSDVVFSVGPSGRLVRCNRGILKARSSYFRQMFNSGMMESAGGTPSRPVVIGDVSYGVFLAILEYLYTGTVKDGVGGDDIVEVLIVSERYMLDGLKVICEDAIRRFIDVSSVSGLLITSVRHNALVLKKISLDFVLDNFEDVKRTEGFRDLVKEPELLMEILMKTTSGCGLEETYASHFNVTVGCDFLACLEHCGGGGGCRCFLVDRPLTVTMDRARTSMGVWRKARFATGLAFDLITSPFQKRKVAKFLREILEGDGDLLTKELGKLKGSQPGIYETVVLERDRWLGWKVCQAVDGVARLEGGRGGGDD